jgi:hypothetical protein
LERRPIEEIAAKLNRAFKRFTADGSIGHSGIRDTKATLDIGDGQIARRKARPGVGANFDVQRWGLFVGVGDSRLLHSALESQREFPNEWKSESRSGIHERRKSCFIRC